MNKSHKLKLLFEKLFSSKFNSKDSSDDYAVRRAHNALSSESAAKDDLSNSNSKGNLAVFHYSGGGYGPINRHLRGISSIENEKTYPNYHKEQLYSAINDLKKYTVVPTQHKFYTFRAISEKHHDLTPGSYFKDKGFTSTSLRPDITKEFGSSHSGQLFRIHIKPGTKGHYLGAHDNYYSFEREFVLHPGTTFRVGNTYTHVDGRKFTNLHVHSQEE